MWPGKDEFNQAPQISRSVSGDNLRKKLQKSRFSESNVCAYSKDLQGFPAALSALQALQSGRIDRESSKFPLLLSISLTFMGLRSDRGNLELSLCSRHELCLDSSR